MDFVQFSRPTAHLPDPAAVASDGVRTFVFMANLAAQEACGDAAASTSVARVLTRLKGSSESDTVLLGLCDSAPLGAASSLGYPLVDSTDTARNTGSEPDYLGFVHVTFPLLEDTDTVEIDLVLDAGVLPLPGEDLTTEEKTIVTALLSEAEALAHRFARRRCLVELLHPAHEPIVHDPLVAVLQARGYRHRYSERQAVLPLTPPDTPVLPPAGYQVVVWENYGIAERYLDDFMDLLTVASVDIPSGGIDLDPINWDRARIADAAERLRDRQGNTLVVGLIDTANDKLCSLCELARHHGSDPQVAEWTITVTAREYRRQGLASTVKQAAMQAAAQRWTQVRRIYGSIPDGHAAMTRIYRHLHANAVSTSSTWELAVMADDEAHLATPDGDGD